MLTLSCPDKPGIVYAVSSFLVQHSANILASQQYGQPETIERPGGWFFMRVHFSVPSHPVAAPGQPLQAAERQALFDPYRHGVGNAINGLGLALARAVVELHEGRIWVEEIPAGGCAFVFELDLDTGAPRPKRTPGGATT